jgi:chromosome segregation ATPase
VEGTRIESEYESNQRLQEEAKKLCNEVNSKYQEKKKIYDSKINIVDKLQKELNQLKIVDNKLTEETKQIKNKTEKIEREDKKYVSNISKSKMQLQTLKTDGLETKKEIEEMENNIKVQEDIVEKIMQRIMGHTTKQRCAFVLWVSNKQWEVVVVVTIYC